MGKLMIDNYNLIRSLLTFKPHDLDTFYDVQVLTRGKDHPELASANHTIRSYYVTSIEQFDKIQDEIHKLCDLFGARCYVNLSPKSLKKTALLQAKNLAKRIYDDDFKKIWKTWASASGAVKSEKPKWVVDIDTKEPSIIEDTVNLINSLQPYGNKILSKIPTLNGCHLITSPFRLDEFKKEFPDIDVHKNNPTLMYVPNCLIKNKKITQKVPYTISPKLEAFLNAHGISCNDKTEIGEILDKLYETTGYKFEINKVFDNKFEFIWNPEACNSTYSMKDSTVYDSEEECYENAIYFLIKHTDFY